MLDKFGLGKTKMKVGVIYCGYNQLDNIKESLCFWNDLQIDGIEFSLAVVSVPFIEYRDMLVEEDSSVEFIKSLNDKNIKYKIFDPKFVKEGIARSLGLKQLLSLGVDIVWQVDSDEFYTVEDVKNICEFIKGNDHPTYSINFKNYILDGKHYLDKYCTVRIYKNYERDRFLGFIDDCTMMYENKRLVQPLEIPKNLAWIKHMTWLHTNGKQKVEYQLRHFGACSYRWNDEKSELEIDFDYYRRHGYQVPTILKDE